MIVMEECLGYVSDPSEECLWYVNDCYGRVFRICILPQNALKRDCNGKCIERIKGHYLEVVVLL